MDHHAQVVRWNELLDAGGYACGRDRGTLRLEGRECAMHGGDDRDGSGTRLVAMITRFGGDSKQVAAIDRARFGPLR